MKRWLLRLRAHLGGGDTVILLLDGDACCRRGKVRPALLAELTALATEHRVDGAILRATGDRLSFVNVPERLHQRFRNLWACHSS